ncbi:enoyl-CoA hydratase, partial [Bacillus mycoides]|nr:enoyl-CoA hydratase [Bacillus mycoides]
MRLLDRKLRKKKDFSHAFYNYISIIFMLKRGVYIMEVTSKTESVVVKYEGRVATVMVNRPEVLNALDEPTLKELLQK